MLKKIFEIYYQILRTLTRCDKLTLLGFNIFKIIKLHTFIGSLIFVVFLGDLAVQPHKLIQLST